MKKAIVNETGYKCPICQNMDNERAMIETTKPLFVEYPSPHYIWEETYKCAKCETLYLIHNGT